MENKQLTNIKPGESENYQKPLYSEVHSRLDKYYPLIEAVISDSLSEKMLREVFSNELAEEIILVNKSLTKV
jgi:hypothetical protein